MQCTEPCVLEGSEYYFTTPSAMAKSLLFYALCAGNYRCSAGYHIRRKKYNSVLLMYFQEGTCTVCTGGKTFRAQAGDIALLNCYQPHEYFTEGRLEFLWLHFDGSQSLEFAEAITRAHGTVFSCRNPGLFGGTLHALIQSFREGGNISEPSVSAKIYTLLCNLMTPTAVSGGADPDGGLIDDALRYIQDHLDQVLTVERISREVHLSPSYFSRVFKKRTGISPYEYVIKARINLAKKLLKSTGMTIQEIAEQSGFNSQSNFIYTFHEKVGISPSRFRSTPF